MMDFKTKVFKFLAERRHWVGVAGTFSTWTKILSGMPQGSVLGPVLLICFINDMLEVLRSFIYLYADDMQDIPRN